MGASPKLHTLTKLQASDLFSDLPTESLKLEAEEEEATRMYIAPSAQQLSSLQPRSAAKVLVAEPESLASIGGWDAGTHVSAAPAPRASFKAPAKRAERGGWSRGLVASAMGAAVLLTGGGAVFAASRMGSEPTVAVRAVPPSAQTSAPVAVASAPQPVALRPEAPPVALAPSPQVASVETLYAALQADKAAAAVASKSAQPVHAAKVAKAAVAAPKVTTRVAKAAPARAAAPTEAPKKIVRAAKSSDLDDAL